MARESEHGRKRQTKNMSYLPCVGLAFEAAKFGGLSHFGTGGSGAADLGINILNLSNYKYYCG